MELTVKSEPCEELYRAHESDYQDSKSMEGIETSQQSQQQNHLKRLHQDIEDTNAIGRNVNQNANNSYFQQFGFHRAPHIVQECFNSQEVIQNQIMSDGKQFKKHKKLEANVLFKIPFFNLVEELSVPDSGGIAARCYSCGKVVKGNRGISSNFIKHMKRSHPETYRLYDDYKTQKTKSYFLPNLPELVTRKSTPIVENGASGSDTTAANSNDDTNQFFRSSKVPEATVLNYSSDDNEDLENSKSANAASSNHSEFSAKFLEALNSIIDEKMNVLFQKVICERLNEKVDTCHVGSKSGFTELRIEVDNLKKECSELRLAIKNSAASKRQLQNELQTVDKLLHQRKLIIRNILVCDPDNPIKSVEKLFKETMHLEDIKIVHCAIIPSIKTSIGTKKETLSVELANTQDCKAIFRQTKKLKNTGIFIESEISPFQLKRKNKVMVLRKELLRRKPDLKVLVRDTTLVVNGKNFYWDDVEGVCHDSKHEAIHLNGIEYLKSITGLDLKEFILFLQNYNVQTT